MHRILTCSLLTYALASAPAVADRVWSDEKLEELQQLTEEQFQLIQELARALTADFVPSEVEITPEYSLEPVPEDLSDQRVEDGLAALPRAFFLANPYRDRIELQGDAFLMPGTPYLEMELELGAVESTEGVNLLRPPTEEEKREDQAFGMNKIKDGTYSQWLRLKKEVSPNQTVIARGTAHVRAPVRFDHVTFNCSEGPVQRSSGQLDIRLAKCENDYVNLRWHADLEDEPIVIFSAANQRRLLDGPRKHGQLFEGNKDVTEVTYAESRKGPTDIVSFRARAKGKIDRVDVFLANAWVERSLPVTAALVPDPIARPRFLPDPIRPRYESLSAQRLRAETRIVPDRSEALLSFNRHELNVVLPQIDNSVFAQIELKTETVRIVDSEGKPLPLEVSLGAFEHPELQHRFDIESTDDSDESEPREYGRATGQFEITYPRTVRVLTFGPGTAEIEGYSVRIDGHKVTLVEPILSDISKELRPQSFTPDAFEPMRAYDREGRRLRKLGGSYGSFQDRRETSQSFWGEVAKLHLAVGQDWTTFTVPFDLVPAPPRETLGGLFGAPFSPDDSAVQP